MIHRGRLPPAARAELSRDAAGAPPYDPGIEAIVHSGIEWLCRAQRRAAGDDGGIARHYSLVDGWSASYPETTGYIVPTLLDWYARSGEPAARETAIRALDWLTSIQFPEGGFQGGTIGAEPKVPVTFNTGQILLGLAAGAADVDRDAYLEPMVRAADWLCDTQDEDGAWRRHSTPFAKPGDKAYETHVAWGLLEAGRVSGERRHIDAAMRNVAWALTRQRANGWFDDNCLNDPAAPLTHTIGYVLRGVLEGWRYGQDDALLRAACKSLDALVEAVDDRGALPGRLDSSWRGTVPWVCLTGCSQIAHCLLMAHGPTRRATYLEAGRRLNRFVRTTIDVDGPLDIRGAVKGSFPVDGAYGAFEYLNWAAKFTIDSNLLERDIDRTDDVPAT